MNLKKSPIEFVNLTFSIMMILLTLSGAIAFLFTDFMNDKLFGWRRIVLAVIFIFYTIYRGIRLKKLFVQNH
jgi:uncharacterized membrane protein